GGSRGRRAGCVGRRAFNGKTGGGSPASLFSTLVCWTGGRFCDILKPGAGCPACPAHRSTPDVAVHPVDLSCETSALSNPPPFNAKRALDHVEELCYPRRVRTPQERDAAHDIA